MEDLNGIWRDSVDGIFRGELSQKELNREILVLAGEEEFGK